MVSISLCMIVKDEEDTLPRCLECVKGVADEIVIVDTGSSDATKTAAGNYTDKVFDFPWADDFSAARNFSFSLAVCDYILWLDADDVLLPGDAARFLELKKSLDPATDVVMMQYHTGFDAQGHVTFSYFRERLVKRSRGFRWFEPVHEYLETFGQIVFSDICITHQKVHPPVPGRNLAIYETILKGGGSLTPRGLYYYARELKDAGRHADAVEAFERFLSEGKGWVEDDICACTELAACHKALGGIREELGALLRSLEYDVPRAETCCALGYHFKAKGDYRLAAYWFLQALDAAEPPESRGFVQPECHGYIPCIELAVCYDRLGRKEEAFRFNEKAAAFKPGDPSVEYNRKYFETLAGR